MPLLTNSLSKDMQSFIQSANKMTQEDANKAIEAYCNKLEQTIFDAIKSITITIPPGAIITAGTAVAQSNPAPIVLTGVVQ